MNSPWMTTLLSQVRKEMTERGLRLSVADLAALVEELSPSVSRTALGATLDFLKPYTMGLGLRISRLSDTRLEAVLPVRNRNITESGHLHEGVLITGALEAIRLLWERHAPLGGFSCEVSSLRFTTHRPADREVRIRLELSETQRESILSLLRQNHHASSEMSVRFVDESEQILAEMDVNLRLKFTPSLEAPDDSAKGS